MKQLRAALVATAFVAGLLGGTTAAFGTDLPIAKNPVVLAVAKGDCPAAAKFINRDVQANDGQTAFIAGRMLDEGLCLLRNPELAGAFYSRSADLGERAAQLDYAAKIGLGEGTTQDYAVAGNLCRTAGIDPQNRVLNYSLGYACTVRALVGRKLRESLPGNTFQNISGAAARVEFNPASGQLLVRAMSKVSVGESSTGSRIAPPLVDVPREIDKAWRQALTIAPKPDAALLENAPVEVLLDLDMTLEQGHKAAQRKSPDQIRSLESWDLARSSPVVSK